MSLLYSLMILFYWLFLSGVIFLAGAYVSRVFVTGPAGAEACFSGIRNRYFGETVTKSLLFISVLTLLVNAVHFVLHCSIMTETPLNEVFSILPTFITKTKYGRLTIWKTVFVGALIVLSFVNVLKDQKWATLSGLLFSMLLLVLIAMSGHQGAKGYMNFPFYLDVLHLFAVSFWIGGLIFISFFLSVFIRGARLEFWSNFTMLINRFSQLATLCVVIAVLTGVLLSYVNVSGFAVLVNTQYGIILLVKMVLVGKIAIIGAMNKFSVVPFMNDIGTEKGSESFLHARKMLKLVAIEAGLGLVVLLLTSLLTHLSPEG